MTRPAERAVWVDADPHRAAELDQRLVDGVSPHVDEEFSNTQEVDNKRPG